MLRQAEALQAFRPYDKQIQFAKLTADNYYVALFAGNQLGKTLIGAMIDTMHVTGDYQPWYPGIRFDEAPTVWCSSVNPDALLDGIQFNLFGGGYKQLKMCLEDSSVPYRGIIPKRLIRDVKRADGLADWIKTAYVQHTSGGVSEVSFRHYELGREKFQARTGVDWIHPDEEPPIDIWYELVARGTNGQQGNRGILTFTPLKGRSELIGNIMDTPDEDWKGSTHMTIILYDLPDWVYTPEEKARIFDQYPARERDARIFGKPIFGVGPVFEKRAYELRTRYIDDANVPDTNTFLHSIDIGFRDHMGFCRTIYSPQGNKLTLQRSIKVKGANVSEFTAAVRSLGIDPGTIPCAWPSDGNRKDKRKDKKEFIQTFREQGWKMLGDYARHPKYGRGRKVVVDEIDMAANQGQIAICEGNNDFEQEWDDYHIKLDGQLSDGRDDLLDAFRYNYNCRTLGRHLKGGIMTMDDFDEMVDGNRWMRAPVTTANSGWLTW